MNTPNIELQKTRLLDEVRSTMAGPHALEKLRFVRENFDWAIEGYRNSLTILSDTTYEDRKHFLLELIQNADDATYGSHIPEITFTITPKGLELHYNEEGFSADDIISITDTGASTKKSKKNNTSFIGEKGIGFKSVFALADTVEIQSGPWHFLLKKEACIVPIPVHSEKHLDGTRLKIQFRDPHAVEEIHKELQRYVSGEVESFLYLQKISKFNLIDGRHPEEEPHQIEILPAHRRGNRLTIKVNRTGEEREFLLYSEDVIFDKTLVAARWEKIGTSLGNVTRKVTVAAMVRGNRKDGSGRLFCYLPTSVRLPIPVFLQVDGMTKADRERLHDPVNNPWNHYLLSKLPDIVTRAIVEWSKTMESPDLFHPFLPISNGEDQLHDVFGEVRRRLGHASWVKVMGEKDWWMTPAETLNVPPYLSNLLHRFPDLRKPFELYARGHLVAPAWSASSKLAEKLKIYGVEMMTPLGMIGALLHADIPMAVLHSPEDLLELYQFLLDLMNGKFSDDRRISDSMKKGIKEQVQQLKIFPLLDEGFSSVDPGKEVYYISSTPAQKLHDRVHLIDPAYTYALSTGDSEDTSKQGISPELRTMLMRLLMHLEIRELSEETMIMDFILPDLKHPEGGTYKERMDGFLSLFAYFSDSKKHSRSFLKLLESFSDICLYDSKKKLQPLKHLLLPKDLRFSSADSVYDAMGLKELYIDDHYASLVSQEKDLFREFLLRSGVKYAPTFHVVEEVHADSVAFHDKDPDRYFAWSRRVGSEYRKSSKILVHRVVLDATDIALIENMKLSKEYEQKLHRAWKEKFPNPILHESTKNFDGAPLPGYFTVTYKKSGDRCVQLKDLSWAGVDPKRIPVRILSDGIVPASSTFIAPLLKLKQVKYLMEDLPAIGTEDRNWHHASYSPIYIKSLGIQEVTFSHLEPLWKKVPESREEDILRLILELIDSGLSSSDLKIPNKSTGRLQSIQAFALGNFSPENRPLIEVQYGPAGKLVGTKCGLPKEGILDAHLHALKTLMTGTLAAPVSAAGFLMLLQEWPSLPPKERMVLIDEFKNKVEGKQPPILVFNDMTFAEELTAHKIWSIHLEENLSGYDESALKSAAKDIGFILPNHAGALKVSDPHPLSTALVSACDEILKSYVYLLETKEIQRLNSKLHKLGGLSGLFHHILLATKVSRVIESTDVEYPVPLPYFDEKDRKIILSSGSSPYTIIKDVLLLVEFAPRRNIIQDLASIEGAAKDEAHRIEKSQKKKSSTKDPQDSLEDTALPLDSEDEENMEIAYSSTTTEEHNSSRLINEPPHLAQEDANPSQRDLVSDPPIKEVKSLDSLKDVVENFAKQLMAKNHPVLSDVQIKGWKTGPAPEEEEELRDALVQEIAKSLNEGSSIYQKRLRNTLKPLRSYKGAVLKAAESLNDAQAVDPRAFLESEYDCKCQVCSSQLVFDSGKKWINVYHIQEKKDGAWFYNRPFNFLGLCPKCYTIAKHGGAKDFSSIISEAQQVLNGETFSEPVDDFGGDYYLVGVMLDHQKYSMKVSKLHMSYFAALLQTTVDEAFEQ